MISYDNAKNVKEDSLLHVLVDGVSDWGDHVKLSLRVLDGPLKDEVLEVDSDFQRRGDMRL